MSAKKKMIADLLFGVQIAGAFVLCGSQFFRMLRTVEGVSLSMFFIIEAYLCLQLLLGIAAHRAQPSRVTAQTLAGYFTWIVLLLTNVFAVFWNGSYRWSANDTWTTALTAGGSALVLGYSRLNGLALQDPAIKGLLSSACRVLPQLFLAAKVAQEGGAGLPGLAVVVGNLTILVRIAQVSLAIREAGWERNRRWLLISESANEAS